MPAKDLYHQTVKQALIKANWTITHDPLFLSWAKRKLFVDLGAKQLIVADKQERKIAVEIKSFLSESIIVDLEQALGQYILYQDILQQIEPERELYLALPKAVFEELFDGNKFAKILLDNNRLKLIIFEPKSEEIVKWIH